MNGWETHFFRPIKFFGKSNSIRDNWTTVANWQVLLGFNAFLQKGDLFCTKPLIFSFKRSNDIRMSCIAYNLTLRWPYNFMFMFSRVNCLYSRRAVIPPIQISLKDLVMPPVVLIRRANAESGEFLLCATSQPIFLFGFWKENTYGFSQLCPKIFLQTWIQAVHNTVACTPSCLVTLISLMGSDYKSRTRFRVRISRLLKTTPSATVIGKGPCQLCTVIHTTWQHRA